MTQDEFLKLCAEGSCDEIYDAIVSGIDPDEPGSIGNTPMVPMFAAASAGNKETVKALTEFGVDCADGFTGGVAGHNFDIIRLLSKLGGDINKFDANGYNAIITAVTTKQLDMFDFLVRLGADVEVIDDEGRNLVMYAVMVSHEDDPHPEAKYNMDVSFLHTILAYGIDPNVPDKKGRTPLMLAAIDYELEEGVIDDLLSFGADINAQDNIGLTPLMMAVASIDRMPNMMLPALIRTGGMMAEDSDKWCALIALYTVTCHEIQVNTVRRLIKAGADVNITDESGMNAMMYALANGDDETIDLLSNAGAKITFDII